MGGDEEPLGIVGTEVQTIWWVTDWSCFAGKRERVGEEFACVILLLPWAETRQSQPPSEAAHPFHGPGTSLIQAAGLAGLGRGGGGAGRTTLSLRMPSDFAPLFSLR